MAQTDEEYLETLKRIVSELACQYFRILLHKEKIWL